MDYLHQGEVFSMIKFKNVSFNYDSSEKSAIKNIFLEVKQGELVVFCGKSGSGKSTIAKLINGLIPKMQSGKISGHIYINKQDVSELAMYELSKMIGSVFQNPKTQFYNIDTTSELAFNLENQGLEKDYIKERINFVMKKFNIEHLLNRNIFELSGGEKQIIACASILIANPKIVVLDEPSSNLDIYSMKKLKEMILYMKEQGKTIVLIEHRIDYIIDCVDSVYYMESGNLAFHYSVKEFKSLPKSKFKKMGIRYSQEDLLKNKPATGTSDILMNNFMYTYDKFSKFKQLNSKTIAIPKNNVVAIIGNNGSGKSTFAKCLCGLYKDFKGQVIYGNQRLKRKQLLKKSYLVFQDVNSQLFTERVDQELKLLNFNVNDFLVDNMLEKVKLLEKKYEHPLTLSGGEKQRLAISTALLSEKEMIIFDEPTSGLDLYHMEKVARLIKDLHDSGKQIFIITHDKSLILEVCTYVIHFEHGQIINQYPLNNRGLSQLNGYFDL